MAVREICGCVKTDQILKVFLTIFLCLFGLLILSISVEEFILDAQHIRNVRPDSLRDKLFLISSQDCHGDRMVMIVCKFGETHHRFFIGIAVAYLGALVTT